MHGTPQMWLVLRIKNVIDERSEVLDLTGKAQRWITPGHKLVVVHNLNTDSLWNSKMDGPGVRRHSAVDQWGLLIHLVVKVSFQLLPLLARRQHPRPDEGHFPDVDLSIRDYVGTGTREMTLYTLAYAGVFRLCGLSYINRGFIEITEGIDTRLVRKLLKRPLLENLIGNVRHDRGSSIPVA